MVIFKDVNEPESLLFAECENLISFKSYYNFNSGNLVGSLINLRTKRNFRIYHAKRFTPYNFCSKWLKVSPDDHKMQENNVKEQFLEIFFQIFWRELVKYTVTDNFLIFTSTNHRSTNQAIYSALSIKRYCCIVRDSSALGEE